MYLYTLILFGWYSCARWVFFDYFEHDPHVMEMLSDPYINIMSVYTGLYLFVLIMYKQIKPYLKDNFYQNGYHELIMGLYAISTFYLFIYHSYCYSFIFYAITTHCKISLFINGILNPIPLIYFSIKMYNMFECVKRYHRCVNC